MSSPFLLLRALSGNHLIRVDDIVSVTHPAKPDPPTVVAVLTHDPATPISYISLSESITEFVQRLGKLVELQLDIDDTPHTTASNTHATPTAWVERGDAERWKLIASLPGPFDIQLNDGEIISDVQYDEVFELDWADTGPRGIAAWRTAK